MTNFTNLFRRKSASEGTEEWAHVTEATRMLAGVIEKSLDAKGINLMMNNREHAGQVVDHAHVHIIPRFAKDGHRQWSHASYKENEAHDVQEKIRMALQ